MWLAKPPFCPVSAPISRSARKCDSSRSAASGTLKRLSKTGVAPLFDEVDLPAELGVVLVELLPRHLDERLDALARPGLDVHGRVGEVEPVRRGGVGEQLELAAEIQVAAHHAAQRDVLGLGGERGEHGDLRQGAPPRRRRPRCCRGGRPGWGARRARRGTAGLRARRRRAQRVPRRRRRRGSDGARGSGRGRIGTTAPGETASGAITRRGRRRPYGRAPSPPRPCRWRPDRLARWSRCAPCPSVLREVVPDARRAPLAEREVVLGLSARVGVPDEPHAPARERPAHEAASERGERDVRVRPHGGGVEREMRGGKVPAGA